MNCILKKTKLVYVVFVLLVSIKANAQSQAELTAEAMHSHHEADSILNVVYKKIIKQHSDDTLFINNLRTSQRLWIKFRDAELKLKYPDYGPNYYGSMHSMNCAYYLRELTRKRIITLNSYLESE